MQSGKEEIEKCMKKCLLELPYHSLVNKYGFSHISVATISEKFGDLRKFPTHKHFVSSCGFNVSQKQSGIMNKKRFITKKGNSLLRLTFYMLTLSQIKYKKTKVTKVKEIRHKK